MPSVGSQIKSMFRETWSKMHLILLMPVGHVLFGQSFFSSAVSSVSSKLGIKQTQIPDTTTIDSGILVDLMAQNLAISMGQSDILNSSAANALDAGGSSAAGKLLKMGASIEALISEALFISGNMWYYKFLINPQSFRLQNQKLQVEEETSDLAIINTYRNKSKTMMISGISGATIPRSFMVAMNEQNDLPKETSWYSRYPKTSQAWFKFRQLEKFYNDIDEDILILYDMDLYVGKFSSFNYSQDANNPWVINYDMQLKIYPGMTLHTLSVYDYSSFFDALVERYGRSISKNFEGKSAAQDSTGGSTSIDTLKSAVPGGGLGLA